MPLQDWPEAERPRERLLRQGAHTLSDAELLAIFLRTGVVGKSAVDLARDLIALHGSLQTLSQIDLDTWCRMAGLGPAKYAQFKACLEMARRCLVGELQAPRTVINDPSKLIQLAQLQIGLSPVEQLLVIGLDSQLRLLKHEVLFTGTINQTAVYPREVLQFALEVQASRLMLAHNHPSGHCQPSAADDQLTRTLQQALGLIDVELVDHLIVCGDQHYSYRQAGRLP